MRGLCLFEMYYFNQNKLKYLGYDDDFGYLYSIFIGYDKKHRARYGVYSVRSNVIECLITYPVLREEKQK